MLVSANIWAFVTVIVVRLCMFLSLSLSLSISFIKLFMIAEGASLSLCNMVLMRTRFIQDLKKNSKSECSDGVRKRASGRNLFVQVFLLLLGPVPPPRPGGADGMGG